MAVLIRLSRSSFLFLFIFTFLLFYSCFLVCFFPIKKNPRNVPTQKDIFHSSNDSIHDYYKNLRRQALFKRLVFIVIDSLRADFVIDNRYSFMTYLSQLLQQGRAIGHYGITHPPTVTLPRIKVSFLKK